MDVFIFMFVCNTSTVEPHCSRHFEANFFLFIMWMFSFLRGNNAFRVYLSEPKVLVLIQMFP